MVWTRYAGALLAATLVAIGIGSALAQTTDELEALRAQAARLFGEGKYAEALATQRTLAAGIENAERAEAGAPARKTAEALMAVAWYALFTQEPAEALTASEHARGLAPELLAIETNRAHALLFLDRGSDARDIYLANKSKRLDPSSDKTWEDVIAEDFDALTAAGTPHHAFADILAALGIKNAELNKDIAAVRKEVEQLYAAGKYQEAVAASEILMALTQKRYGEDRTEFAEALNWLAISKLGLNLMTEAEALLKRSLAIFEKALGRENQSVAVVLENLSTLYQRPTHFRLADAEAMLLRSLSIHERLWGPEHRELATMLDRVVKFYERHDRTGKAEPLLKRSLDIVERALPPEHPDIAKALDRLIFFYSDYNRLYSDYYRLPEAESLLKRRLAISEKRLERLDSSMSREEKAIDASTRARPFNMLADLYVSQRRYAEAEPLLKRVLDIYVTALGPDDPSAVRIALAGLANVYQAQGRFADAETLYLRSLALYEKARGRNDQGNMSTLNNLAWLAYGQSNWSLAADYWRRSTDVIKHARRIVRGHVKFVENGSEIWTLFKGDQRLGEQFAALVRVTHRLAAQGNTQASLAAEMFETAQWGEAPDSAAAIAYAAARSASGPLADLVREHQDLEIDQDNKMRLIPLPWNEVGEISERLAEIDRRLERDFPHYVALARPLPLSVAEVQAQLGVDEALVLFLDTPSKGPLPEETFVWVVTKSEVRWVRSHLGTEALKRGVAALRCGLDAAAWHEGRGSRCASLLNTAPDKAPKANEPLPFDVSRAHEIYNALFGEVEDLIRGKHLLIVPSGPLTQLPFHVLVTEPMKRPASATNLRHIAWLARSHAITVLPAVSSLKALRRVAKPSAATSPMIGFGNPLLDGDPRGHPGEAQLAKLSREKQTCRPRPWQRVAGVFDKHRSVERVPMRGGHADLEHLRLQAPLPETADELCAVARDLRLEPDDILLGARATETNVRQLSSDGKLSAYRVVHFATHGTVAGEIEGTTEPGLILTPPQTASDLDDGYLSASEVAALKLDADWVVLSACNTAAGGAQGAEALSGLARAFIYAGARSLLVSHWAVPSVATAKLVSTAVGATARDKKLGRAEALRRAMLAMIDKGAPHEAHPAYWAPFVVVGEGAAAR